MCVPCPCKTMPLPFFFAADFCTPGYSWILSMENPQLALSERKFLCCCRSCRQQDRSKDKQQKVRRIPLSCFTPCFGPFVPVLMRSALWYTGCFEVAKETGLFFLVSRLFTCSSSFCCRYYKRFSVAEMELLKIPLSNEALTHSHANNTLIISYLKPRDVLHAVSCLAGFFLCISLLHVLVFIQEKLANYHALSFSSPGTNRSLIMPSYDGNCRKPWKQRTSRSCGFKKRVMLTASSNDSGCFNSSKLR